MFCRFFFFARLARRLLLAAAICCVLTLSATPASRGQGADPAAELSRQGSLLFDQSKYPEAMAVYENIVKAYPNSGVAPDAQLRLAYCQFFTGQYQPAVDRLKKLISTPSTPADILELAAALLPQTLSQQGAVMSAKDRKRKGAFENAIKEYGNTIQKYPRSAELENLVYGRAVAYYQLGRFDEAAADLRQNLSSFADSENTDDNAYLLALTLASQANQLLADPAKSEANTPAALKNYEEARKALTAITASKYDLALANDAQFQLGQTVLAQAAASPEAAQPELLKAALAAFRAVEPKEPMIAAQTARVARLRELRLTELRKAAAANRDLVRRYESRLLREQGKLAELQVKEDPSLSARLQSGAVFYQLKRYDETRVLMTALAPSAADIPENEKVVLYYTALSYANQNVVDKAVTAYDNFQAKYVGDPIAENLPLVIGNLFLNAAQPDAEKANQYFAEFVKTYPKSRLRNVASIQQATAAAALKHYDEALALLTRFLRGSPQRDMAAAAELTRARIIKDMADFPKAYASFRKIFENYADRPEAEEAAFWLGWTALQQKDYPRVLRDAKTFLDKYPQSKLASNALLVRSQALQATNAKDQALATLNEAAKRAPDSPEVASVYFQRANIYLSDNKLDAVAKTLGEFMEKYPDDPQAFAACDRLASIQAQAGRFDLAAETYQNFTERQAASENAPEALGKLAAVWQRAARAMGGYVSLAATQREGWTRAVNNSIAASEKQLTAFPDAPATALGLQNLFDCQQLLLDAKIKSDAQVAEYFLGLAERYDEKSAARSRLLFLIAALVADKDPDKARTDMAAAYDPAVIYSPADLDRFGEALLAAKDYDTAGKVFQKLAADYPNPPGATPAQAPVEVQQAQAVALYGRGRIAELQGDAPTAINAYTELKKNYPRSPKAATASLGLAQSLITQGNPADALPLLAEVSRSAAMPLTDRARGMFLTAKVLEIKGQPDAIDAYLKVAAFYPTAPQAAEGLWTGAQLLERQADTLSDKPAAPGGPTRASQLAKARKAYETLVGKYPDAKWAEEARQRLASLPPTAKS